MQIIKSDVGIPHIAWAEKYGGIVMYRGLFNKPRIFITDSKALLHVMVSSVYDYPKPPGFIRDLKPLLRSGILLAEGDTHKRQRKMMNPAFNFTNVKEMIPTFAKVGHIMKDLWIKEIGDNEKSQIDIMTYLSKATLDVIGLVGFNYEFNSLTSKNELAEAYTMIFTPQNRRSTLLRIMSNYIPFFNKLPIEFNIRTREASRIIDQVSNKLVTEKLDKAKLGELEGNDLLTILIRQNEQTVIKEDKMTEHELKNQIMTFLAAGHETTSVAIGWALYFLSKNIEVQNTLRNELLEAFPDKDFIPTFDQINSLEFLNCVVKETLRVNPAVPMTIRTTKKDDVISGYMIPRGTPIFLFMNTIHRLPSIWGSDASTFKPSRWLDPNITSIQTNYTYIPFLTGPRSCIGNKLALNEFKVMLAILIRNFKFTEIDGFEVKSKLAISLRPDPTIKLWVEKLI
ncbi:cytochrome P450 [Rhizophagus diaphanus]|nr:cytochrome P450 [Rhizophagus diaphanus] [Rhizophagus sp. MUCL 43196]